MVKVLARDLAKDKQTDSFMGKGFEKLLKQAEEKNCDVIVGQYFGIPYLDE